MATSVPPGTHIHGWMNEPELWWLYETAKQMRCIVEVGSLHGRSSFALLAGCSGPVYCIDPWSTSGSLDGFWENVKEHSNCYPIQATSPPDWVWQGEEPDMVFLDGDHSYEAVKADIDYWLPLTQKLICGHDYSDDEGFPGVKQAVREAFGKRAKQEALPGIEALDSPIWSVWL